MKVTYIDGGFVVNATGERLAFYIRPLDGKQCRGMDARGLWCLFTLPNGKAVKVYKSDIVNYSNSAHLAFLNV